VRSENEANIDGVCSELATVILEDRAWPSTIQLCDQYEQVAPLCTETCTQPCFYNEDPPACDATVNYTTHSIDDVHRTCACLYYVHLKDVVFVLEHHTEILSSIRSPAFCEEVKQYDLVCFWCAANITNDLLVQSFMDGLTRRRNFV